MRTCCRSRAEWCGRCVGRLSIPCRECRDGFARVEAVALVFVMLAMAALLLASGSYERRTAMLNRDLANLRQIGAWTFMYTNDFENLHPSLSSAPHSIYPDVLATLAQPTPFQANGQVIDIIRRRTGRENMPIPTSWVSHVLYTHLVLADYAERVLPDTIFVASGDAHRLRWLDDPINRHDQGFWQPFQNPESGAVLPKQWRWPYSSSFHTPSAFWDKTPEQTGVVPASNHNSLSIRNENIGPVNHSRMKFPSQKVMLHDYGSWYTKRTGQYFAVESSAATMLMGDGAAVMRRTAEANAGWFPFVPADPMPSRIAYVPRLWEPPTSDGSSREIVTGYYRWTRGGIEGRDFDGPEIDTGQK